jgi:hypothetical protein
MKRYLLHDDVKALWKGGAYYYRGKVIEVNPNDTYLISFETGGEALTHARHISATKFAIGERVKVRRKVEQSSGCFIYAVGTIRRFQANKTYAVTMDSPSVAFLAATDGAVTTSANSTENVFEDDVITLPSFLPGDLVTVSNPTGMRYRGEIVKAYPLNHSNSKPKESERVQENSNPASAIDDNRFSFTALEGNIPTVGDELSEKDSHASAILPREEAIPNKEETEEAKKDEETYDVLVSGRKIVRNVRQSIIDFASGLYQPEAEIEALCRIPVRVDDQTLRWHTGGSDAVIVSEEGLEIGDENANGEWFFAPYTVFCRGKVLDVDEAKSDVTIELQHPIEETDAIVEKGNAEVEEAGTIFAPSTFVMDFGLARSVVLSRENFVRFSPVLSPVTLAVGDIVDWNFSKRLAVRCRLSSIEKRSVNVSLENENRVDEMILNEEWKPEEIEVDEIVGEEVRNSVRPVAESETITETFYTLEYKVTKGANPNGSLIDQSHVYLQRATIRIPTDTAANSQNPLLELVCLADGSDAEVRVRKFNLSAQYYICNGCHSRGRAFSGLCVECAVCDVCHGEENPEDMILCDRCEKGYHTYCLDFEGAEVPTGSWYDLFNYVLLLFFLFVFFLFFFFVVFVFCCFCCCCYCSS